MREGEWWGGACAGNSYTLFKFTVSECVGPICVSCSEKVSQVLHGVDPLQQQRNMSKSLTTIHELMITKVATAITNGVVPPGPPLYTSEKHPTQEKVRCCETDDEFSFSSSPGFCSMTGG